MVLFVCGWCSCVVLLSFAFVLVFLIVVVVVLVLVFFCNSSEKHLIVTVYLRGRVPAHWADTIIVGPANLNRSTNLVTV